MSGEHSIRQIVGGVGGEDIYCSCGTVVHNPLHHEFMSAYTRHVETQVHEQVARDIERKCVGQMMPGAIALAARIARGKG